MSAPIAIIGSACRFPGGADSPSKLWELLENPRDLLVDFPPDRLNLWGIYHENGEHHGSTNVENKGYLLSEDIRLFDAPFFRIRPTEADSMDPQQRLLLETVYEALESAGCPLDQLRGSLTSVFAGLMNHDYGDIQARDLDTLPTNTGTGNHQSILSNRVSYFLDIKGPSMTIDTACSSSMVALHQAIQSLRVGESDMAIVVGANILLDATSYVAESKLQMLSPDSRSRMWDASANGYARGEGFAAIVLKTIPKAVNDGDVIESVIRGSAVNQDGRTAGITAPNSAAHTTLIRAAYRDAGLDPLVDRCQYFEAHGTGTKAGDPVEAKGIHDAFFPEGGNQSGKLFVGSIKTVVGHLEGCAGLAGVLKASLAMQNRTIPPNMHFTELNPAIRPYYGHLEVPTQALPWPKTLPGQPLRASINSYGFGGTNAHVILETYEPGLPQKLVNGEHTENERFVGPLVFSAGSHEALVRSVAAHVDHIRKNQDLDLEDLSWTLQFKRSEFGIRSFFSGATRQALIRYMDSFIAANTAASNTATVAVAGERNAHAALGDESPAILGIFTGQGAQWPSMGRNLILQSPLFRASIAHCEESLAALGKDAPSWSLTEELLAEGDRSRVGEASIAQPLSLAVQIGLIDLLRVSGITWRCSVGHSSGETAAVVAAGIISAHDAIRIAYYRGLHSQLAAGPNGETGGMLAAGLTFESATELCAGPNYAGKLVVAAENSANSVTISGDLDAIEMLKTELDEKKTFVRKLVVDKAYHSHHMKPCVAPFLASLEACNIQVNRPHEDCVWVSTVRGDAELVLDDDDFAGLETLKGQHWVDNLLQPVLFAPAIECALFRAGPFDIAAEVGCHPALKGPSTQIFKASLGTVPPYFSVMRRGTDEVESFSGGLDYFWEHFGSAAAIDFDGYRRAFADDQEESSPRHLVKGLPSYCWDHGRIHWKESRLSRNLRLGGRAYHQVLGRRATDDTPELLRWRNILRPAEIPWVRDHVFQGQMILPGASYIAAITDASKVLANKKHVELVKLLNVKISKAVILDENKSTELVTSLRIVSRDEKLVVADFTFAAASADDSASVPERTCKGRVEVHLSEKSPELPLLFANQLPPNLNAVDVDDFYANLKGLGVHYQGIFRTTKTIHRSLGFASNSASWARDELGRSFAIHPSVLDVGFHTVLAAFASPSSGQMWSMYLPVGFRQITICPDSLPNASDREQEVVVNISSHITLASARGLEADLQMKLGSEVAVQVEGAELHATGDPNATKNRVLFSNMHWNTDISTGISDVVLEKTPDRAAEEELFEAMGRVALYYYQIMLEDISPREVRSMPWFLQMFYKSAQYWVEEVRSGRHTSVRSEWLDNSRETTWKLVEKFDDATDIMLMRAVGENLSPIMRGEMQPLEPMMANNLLSRYYTEGLGLDGMNDHIARAVSQITFRYPQANILEIGAGVGGTTRKILRAIGDSFGSYTFTDISTGFFEKAADKLSAYRRKMIFKVCDIEKDPIEEGFAEGGYEVVVAANVLHATSNFAATMRHVRRLLKPGGYLVIMEITGDLLRHGFLMGPLPGWWLGPQTGDEGRQWAPGISPTQWDDLLQRTGFSGIDQIVSDHTVSSKHYISTIVSQAVDGNINSLREPLSNLSSLPPLHCRLVLVGGASLPVARLIKEIHRMLLPWASSVETVTSLDELAPLWGNERMSIISLTELDQPLFAKDISATRLANLQSCLNRSESILWVTSGSGGQNPTANIFTGIARALRTERPDICIQLLDLAEPSDTDAKVLAETFLRLVLIKRQIDPENPILWSNEPEIALDEDKLFIPRLIANDKLNERYNASRRIVTKQTTLASSTVEIDTQQGVVALLGVDSIVSRRLATPVASDQFFMNVHFSVPLANLDQRYALCYGIDEFSHKPTFALTQNQSSAVLCNTRDTLQLHSESPPNLEPSILEALAGQLIIRSIVTSLPSQGSVLVYEPPSMSLVLAIETSSLWKHRKVYYVTSATATSTPLSWIRLDAHALSSTIKKRLPADITVAIDFSASGARDVRSFLPARCIVRSFEPGLIQTTRQEWVDAFADAQAALKTSQTLSTSAIPIQSVSGIPASTLSYPAIIDWRQHPEASLSIEVKPLAVKGLFSSARTHLMVGLGGDLGQSICGYMVRNGARHIAIASRRGTVDSDWLEMMKKDYKVDIRLFRMDVTNKRSIQTTLEQIKGEMPPIGGVANGAMVLKDHTFLDMDVETLNGTLKPKVDGSRYLDEYFSGRDLDYFILFSSMAAIGNNDSQANYSAANMFMTSLVSNRRARSRAASVIHVGVVVDVGYVARQDRKLPEHLRKKGFMLTSESDVHTLFAEGVLASPADSGLQADICMGLETFQESSDAMAKPPWYTDPRLSHFVVQPEEDTRDSENSGDALPLRERLEEAKSLEETHSLLQEAFSARLEMLMQLSSGTLNVNVPLLDLGFDSLLAVETRTWFLKEIHIDVPVLRFLGGDTASQISSDAAAQFFAARAEAQPEKNATNEDQAKAEENGESPHPASSITSSENGHTSSTGTTSDSHALTKTSSPTSTGETLDETPIPELGSEMSGEEKRPGIQPPVPVPRETSRVDMMSPAQYRLWFLGQYLDDPTTCNIVISYRIRGPLQTTRLHNAVCQLIAHHPSLRTCFFADEETGEPMQGLLRTSSPTTALRCVHATSQADVRREFDALRYRKWDLSYGDGFAATLLSTDTIEEHVIIFGYHHIIIDGISWGIILRDLQRAYISQPLSPQTKLCIDASVQQKQWLESGAVDEEISFWKGVHKDLPPTLPLFPFASVKHRQPLRRYDNRVVTKEIGSTLVNKIKSVSRALRVTTSQFYLAAIQVLLSNLLEIRDLCIGITDASRSDGDLENTVGFFVNMLPLRFQFDGSDCFSTLVQRTSKHVLEARSNGKIPINILIDELQVPRDISSNPLYQVTFNYRPGSMADFDLGDCHMNYEDYHDAEIPFDLGFGVFEGADNSCSLQVIAQSYLYDHEATELIMNVYSNLLDRLSEDTSRTLEQYKGIDAAAMMQVLSLGKGPRESYDWPDTLSKRVETMIKHYGDSVAIVEPHGSLTYDQLDEKNRLVASVIIGEQIPENSVVAVFCQPSADAIISMLASLRLGHIYCPLDTNLPRERHAAILDDCKPAILICHEETLDAALAVAEGLPVVNVSILAQKKNPRLSRVSLDNLSNPTTPSFLLYTSGSTGKPKGILHNNVGFRNHLALKTSELGLQREVVLQQSSLGFDMSLTQIFCALANGGSLAIVPKPLRGDPVAITSLMLDYGVTFTLATPSEYAMFLRYGRSSLLKCNAWKHACTGGETVTQRILDEFAGLSNAQMQLTNCYGPTETSLAVTFDKLSLSSPSNEGGVLSARVGKVLPNYSVYIIDEKSSELVPPGFPGEICVGGAGVAMGYLGLPDLSASKFVPNPFADADDLAQGWTHMFKTGDRGRLRLDGSLIFMGRREDDSMVKVRGLRIDLNDVAETLMRTAGENLAEAAVTVRGEDGETQMLVAHVVLRTDQLAGQLDLLRLANSLPLPAYMRPSVLVPVDRLPHTANGKMDRKAIAAMEIPTLEEGAQPGGGSKLTLEEGELSLLWQNVLGITAEARSKLIPETDFFMAGGNSLLLVKLQGAIRETLGLSVTIAELYQASTLCRMAVHLYNRKGEQELPEAIDWERETDPQVSSASLYRPDAPQTPLPTSGVEVLLTGAHTFLGAGLLETLATNGNVRKIHCVALPASSTIARTSKAIRYPGSLQHESLGLSHDDIAYLQSRIHLIIHAGSIGHCLNNYSSLRAPNVVSLRFLVRLALFRQIPLHFLSSNRVPLLSGQDVLSPVSVEQHPPPTDGTEGFTASKWAGEQLLVRAARSTGLSATVHRSCAVIGPDAPSEDALNSLLRFSISQGAVPRFQNLAGYIDFAPIGAVAANIVQLALQPSQRNEDIPASLYSGDCVVNVGSSPTKELPIMFVHHSSGVRTPVAEFHSRMEKLYRRPFRKLDVREWIEEAVQLGMDPLISTYLETLVDKKQTMAFAYLGEKLQRL